MYKATKAQTAVHHRIRKYGIDEIEYNRLLETQGHRCAICKAHFGPGVTPNVDHDHKTAKVRGLLCTHCNRGLGGFNDEPGVMQSAIAYILRSWQ